MATEKRLIAYAPVTFESFKRHSTKHIDPYYDPYGEGFTDAFDTIEGWLETNTVDAVEVVRCKDCKHGIWDEEEQMWECVLPVDLTGDLDTYSMFHEYNDGEHFCSYGERKDNGE